MRNLRRTGVESSRARLDSNCHFRGVGARLRVLALGQGSASRSIPSRVDLLVLGRYLSSAIARAANGKNVRLVSVRG